MNQASLIRARIDIPHLSLNVIVHGEPMTYRAYNCDIAVQENHIRDRCEYQSRAIISHAHTSTHIYTCTHISYPSPFRHASFCLLERFLPFPFILRSTYRNAPYDQYRAPRARTERPTERSNIIGHFCSIATLARIRKRR